MSAARHEKGPRNVRVTIEYEYDGIEYAMKFPVDSHGKDYVDAIFFGHGTGDAVRRAWRPDSTLKDISGDGHGWPTTTTIPAPVRRGPVPADAAAAAPARPMVEHTPICWHDNNCQFWCV